MMVLRWHQLDERKRMLNSMTVPYTTEIPGAIPDRGLETRWRQKPKIHRHISWISKNESPQDGGHKMGGTLSDPRLRRSAVGNSGIVDGVPVGVRIHEFTTAFAATER